MRYVIRNSKGEELVCPSLADLHTLYAQGFLGDDDLVRAESSRRFVPASQMPALHGVREKRADPRKVAILLAAAAVLVLALALLTMRMR
jgi:hypothetical protein